MLVVPILLRLCFLLLPLTVVSHPANPSSSSKTLDKRGSRDAVEGLGGYVRMLGHEDRPVIRTEDKSMVNPTWTSGEMITNPKPTTPFTSNHYFNITTLASAKSNAYPFDIIVGPLEIAGFVDLENLDVEAAVYVRKYAVGVFKCNLKESCKININVVLAKGTVELYLKNKHEVWLLAKLSLPFGKSFSVDKKVFNLPRDGALAGGTIDGTVTSSGVPVAAASPASPYTS